MCYAHLDTAACSSIPYSSSLVAEHHQALTAPKVVHATGVFHVARHQQLNCLLVWLLLAPRLWLAPLLLLGLLLLLLLRLLGLLLLLLLVQAFGLRCR